MIHAGTVSPLVSHVFSLPHFAVRIPGGKPFSPADDERRACRTLAPSRDKLPLSTTLPPFEPDKSSIKEVTSRKRIKKAAESTQMDGDKKTNGGYESIMTMDDMAIEWVEQVLSFLPLADVYKCKSVCKEWHAAANYVISDWEKQELVFRNFETGPVRTGKNQIFIDRAAIQLNGEVANEAHAQTWIKRLKQLVRLKEIFIPGSCIWSKVLAVGKEVVFRNASTLTLLHMRSERLPFDHKRPVVFHNLQDLECGRMDVDQAAACPRLVNLWTKTSVEVLRKLSAETLTSLRIDDIVFKTISHEEIEQLVAALSRLRREREHT